MCNCDIGVGCGEKKQQQADPISERDTNNFVDLMRGGKHCTAVPKSKCGTETGKNTCLACGADSAYDCEVCCPGLEKVEKGDYSWCQSSKPTPSNTCSPENPR